MLKVFLKKVLFAVSFNSGRRHKMIPDVATPFNTFMIFLLSILVMPLVMLWRTVSVALRKTGKTGFIWIWVRSVSGFKYISCTFKNQFRTKENESPQRHAASLRVPIVY